MPTDSNKRIARNTMMLYIRMLISMVISLYTSRIILQTLGIEDYGIYNIVAGIIVLFSFLNNAMANATQRFLNFALGTGDKKEVDRIFSMSMTAHISIAFLVLLLSETIGLWFLNTQLNIPYNRMVAAQWVYQFSVLTCCINILKVPYNASIITYERMSFYAYTSIIETILKLLIVYLLVLFTIDKLILYAILTCVISLIMLVSYKLYCNKKFDTCQYNFFWDTVLYKQLMSFSGWSLFGASANVGASQGVNILLNVFCGVTVNAAMGIANQVSNAVYQFVSNFQMAFRPQIIKSYAANEMNTFINLLYRASKFSYYLLFIISLPLIICCESVLNIWLLNVPQYAVTFIQLIITANLFDAISAPLWTANEATGKIRNYQICISLLISLNVPFSYLALKWGFDPNSVLFIRVFICLLTLLFRIFYLKKTINFSPSKFIREVVLICVLVSLISIPLPYITNYFISGFIGIVLTTLTSLLTTSLAIYLIGLKGEERKFVLNSIKKIIKR